MKASKNPSGGGGGGGALLQELEALSQALYKAQIVQAPTTNPAPRREFDQMGHRRRVSEAVGRPQKAPPNPSALESRHSISDIGRKNTTGDKELDESLAEEEEIDAARLAGGGNQKKGFWNWKPLRALSHIGQQRFPCEFSAHVHSIDKLPSSMNGLRLQVQLRHRDTGVQTMPARASHGSAEFQEILHFRCTVYGSKSKSSGTIKYMAKSFTLSVVAMDVEELDLGKHQLDLSRILPSQESSGAAKPTATTAWNTSFKLSGKAKGSSLSVTFGYEILESGGGGSKIMGSSGRLGQSRGGAVSRSFNSLPNSPHGSKFHKKTSSSVADFGSPAASEPGNEYEDFAGMDQFKLDDPEEPPPPRPQGLPPPPPTFKASATANTTTRTSMDGVLSDHRRGKSLFPEIDAAIAPGTPGRSQEREEEQQQHAVEDVEQLDDAAEFGVVEKGVETSVLEEFSGSIAPMDRKESSVPDEPREVEEQEQQEDEQEQSLDYKFEEEDDEKENGATNDLQGHQVEEQESKESDREGPAETVDRKKIDEEAENMDWKQQDYDWKQELEQDYLFDSLKNPGWAAREESKSIKVAEYDIKDRAGTDEKMVGDHDYDDEIVADEFLDMLQEGGGDGGGGGKEEEEEEESESPRALLLKQFEKESMLEGFGLEDDQAPKLQEDQEHKGDKAVEQARAPVAEKIVPEDWSYSDDDDKELASIMDAAESELQKATQAFRSKARAKMLEDAEAEALLQEWGLDEKIFHGSPPSSSSLNPEELQSLVPRSKLAEELPALAPGVGSSVPTADGGSLRSMDPALFESSVGERKKNNGKLVMHVSKPVVVPADMGASAMDVLRNFAAAGSESMAAQAMEAMPLEDITGKSVEQIALEGQVCLEESNRRYDAALLESNRLALEDGSSSKALAIPASSSALYQPSRAKKAITAQRSREAGEFVSLDELAPVAMEKIEQLAMQGLKIQCDMADEEAPYSVEASASVPLLKGSSSSSSLLLEAPSSDGMISMSLSLDEWMRLDAGLDDDEEASEKTRAVMAAHRAAHADEAATTADLVLNLSGDGDGGGGASGGGGKMGKTLTLAMLVQLRDPLRNFEPVGAPMMALVEAERVMVSPRPKLWKRVALKGNSEPELEDEEESTARAMDEEEDDRAAAMEAEPQFKVTGIHVAGLSSAVDEPSSMISSSSRSSSKKQAWGSQRQQQSGSRWLVANGMGKNPSGAIKHPLLRSSKSAAASKGKDQSSSLWSVSSSSSSPGVSRNPDVKFAKLGAKKRF
ncbi:hypothetical protein SELMODRAFT_444108 [Selaginella moellendorffii]|uniref:C2 NT-type domain-containing protein n=1 Tax=Selaginella moellendorffii TaxID=88036 RepID=D8S6J4_SELML|nr:protein PLASTID MOVEMENT IMPAIRED 1-RELATED 1 [Selaginella moellendorffii]EFJ19953.1 hypothetical protein SELMODRAFT_444108 [Selaginella moellendorffii]|eukprot:XP_002978996.1 protein PLASTID MOVEMENT IMPAIRED 1-RELATED 1 [Selaginella moellendorffii]